MPSASTSRASSPRTTCWSPPARRAAEHGCDAVGSGGGAGLRFLAATIGARAVVEIGTGTGVSGLWLLRGMAAGRRRSPRSTSTRRASGRPGSSFTEAGHGAVPAAADQRDGPRGAAAAHRRRLRHGRSSTPCRPSTRATSTRRSGCCAPAGWSCWTACSTGGPLDRAEPGADPDRAVRRGAAPGPRGRAAGPGAAAARRRPARRGPRPPEPGYSAVTPLPSTTTPPGAHGVAAPGPRPGRRRSARRRAPRRSCPGSPRARPRPRPIRDPGQQHRVRRPRRRRPSSTFGLITDRRTMRAGDDRARRRRSSPARCRPRRTSPAAAAASRCGSASAGCRG